MVHRLGASSSLAQFWVVWAQVLWRRRLWVLLVVALIVALLSCWDQRWSLVLGAMHWDVPPSVLDEPLALARDCADQFFWA